jgi:23S rRNA pseudouridine1911/1915/1917 synthase
MDIPIIFENNDFLIINKPSGLVIHPFDNSTEETLVDILHTKYPFLHKAVTNSFVLQNGTVIHLGGIVHKLDRETSGIMVVAKNELSYNELSRQFKEHQVRKTYCALVEGVVQEDSFRIDGPLGRNKKEYKQSVNPKNPRSGKLREAITDVRVIDRSSTLTLVELSPLTGRTHQLRAHMAHINHPIVGDKAYGGTIDSPRIMLHAESISFTLFGDTYTFKEESPFTLETIK